MTEREQLEKKLQEIKDREFDDAVDAVWPEIKNMFGGCFKMKLSYSYSCSGDEEFWYKYSKIIQLSRDDIYFGGPDNNTVLATCVVFSFFKDLGGKIHICPEEKTYVHNLGKEITLSEFYDAWGEIKKEINKI